MISKNHPILLLPLAMPLAGSLHAVTVTSIATGEWDLAATWSSAAAAPVTGTQGTGDDFIVASTFTVTSNDTTANAQALVGQSLTVQSGGVLDLARLHASTTQAVTWNLPPVTLQDGAELQFRSSTGTSNHTLAANIAVAGNTTIDNTGGGYGQNLEFSGILSGSGKISYKTANSGSAVTTRVLALKSAASPFTGDWFVQHVNSGDDFGALRADAAGALGSGTVTLDTRAQLINNASGGLNGISAITLLQGTSAAHLGAGWNHPAGVLAVAGGNVTFGSATTYPTSSIASLTHDGGTLLFDIGGPAAYDKLVLSGNFATTSGLIDIHLKGDPGAATYDLIRYGGTLDGMPSPMVMTNSRLTPVYSNGDGSNDTLTVSFTGTTASLVWKGTENANWDTDISVNFDNAGTPDKFLAIDSVTFDDTATSFAPALVGTLVPKAITFNNSANAYTLAGTGLISGTTGIVKNGTGTVNLGGANGQNFTGPVAVNGGLLKLGSRDALGQSSGVTVASGAQVDLNAQTPGNISTGGYAYTIAGTGPDGSGALINSPNTSIASNAGVKWLTLSGNATIATGGGTTSRFDVGFANTAGTGGINTAGHVLTQKGPGSIYYRGPATTMNLVVAEGRAGAESNLDCFGGSGGTVSVAADAQAYLATSGTYQNAFTLAGSGWTETPGKLGALRLGSGTQAAGPITLAADARITAYNSSGTVSGNIGQTGGARKLELGGSGLGASGGTITVSGNNSHTGGTEVRGAIVVAQHANAFGTGDVLVDEGAAATHVTRVELQGVTVANDFTLDSTAQTGFFGPLTASGGSLSTVTGDVTISSSVGNGGHLASNGTGSVLRLDGELVVLNNVVPNIRQGSVILAGGGTYPRLDQGQGTLLLGADNGISPTAQLRLAVSAAGTLDLNGYRQTLSQLNRAASFGATVTNSAAGAAELTIDGTTDHAYSGTITHGSGGVSLVKKGTSALTLSAATSYAGSTSVEGGKLVVNAAHGTAGLSPVTVAAAGTLGGTGPFEGAITVAGTVAPGNSAGTLAANSSVSFGPGSSYAWEVADWTGAAGTGWDLINAADLAFTATPANKLTIVISGAAANFTESAKTFAIATATNPITGFNLAAIQIDDSAFAGTGTWSVQVTGNSLELVYATGAGTPFSSWASTNGVPANPALDSDGDGIPNGIEFVLGGNPAPGAGSNSAALLPTLTTDASYLNFSYRRTDEAAGMPEAQQPYVQFGSTLTGWTKAEGGVNGVILSEVNGTPDMVTVKIPRSLATGGKLFARLKVDIE